MTEPGPAHGSTLIPCLRYRDAPKAIEWLCRAFGFTRHVVISHDENTVAHAQLTLGSGMVMLGSVVDSPYGRLMRQPDEAGGQTQSVYVVVDDVDAVYRQAQAAGARIAIALRDEDYGGRDFSCFDPEGHLWTIGNYDPWRAS